MGKVKRWPMKSGVYGMMLLVLVLPATAGCNDRKTKANNDPAGLFIARDTLVNRKPAFAGTFYPGNRDALMQQLRQLFSAATPSKNSGKIVALVAPHAGYVYSGRVAASAFNQLIPGVKYENVFIIAASHHASFDGAALYMEGHFETPLGIARVNIPLSRKLAGEHPDLFRSYPAAHQSEHSIEVQLPFLQYLFPEDLQIIPVLLGTQRPSTCKKIAEVLRPYFSGNNLFVISTDFSHYPDYQHACETDRITAEAIVKNSAEDFLKTIEYNENQGIPDLVTSICGWTGMLTFLDITERIPGIHWVPVLYMNSGDSPEGDKTRVVGYHALAVTLDKPGKSGVSDEASGLTDIEKEQLLRIARKSIRTYLETGQVYKIGAREYTDKLLIPSGAFVTLNMHGALRGCIGQFTADVPLYQVIQEMAISAATRDNRFEPLSLEELNQTEIEISVLTPMRRISSPEEIVLGRHGVYIKKGNRAGTFLPQVAEQTGWTKEEFLGHCSRDKAGLGWQGWKDAEIFVYEAYVFGEQ
jgi:MEMO1 family protein